MTATAQRAVFHPFPMEELPPYLETHDRCFFIAIDNGYVTHLVGRDPDSHEWWFWGADLMPYGPYASRDDAAAAVRELRSF